MFWNTRLRRPAGDRSAPAWALAFLLAAGCSQSGHSLRSEEDAATATDVGEGDGGSDATTTDDGWYEFTTETFTVKAGDESYYCFAKTLDEDIVYDRLEYDSVSVVHHFLLVQTLAPEPEGFAECPVFFRTTWLPHFATGTSDAELDIPDGHAQTLRKGQQIMIQLHLLNPDVKDVTTSVTVRMRRSTEPEPKPVGIYAFGTNNISLAPQQTHTVQNDCEVEADVELFAFFPHMHTLGTGLSFEVSRDGGEFETLYSLSSWDFDQQFVGPVTIDLKAGDLTRTTCHFDNDTDDTVVFGDSTFNEMCYLVGFTTTKAGLDGCIDLSTPDGTDPITDPPPEGECSEAVPNDKGIGTPCTKGGGECSGTLTCSADQGQAPDDTPGFCLEIGTCQTAADCGGGEAVCCAPAQGGGIINICLPAACRPADCALKN